MEQQNTAHLLDGSRISLRRVPRVDDPLGLHAVNMRALVLDHPIVAILGRAVALDGDNGVRRHLRGYRDRR